MTPLPDEQPLSRRQLREQQRTTETPTTVDPPSRRVSTTSAVPGGSIPVVGGEPQEPALTSEQVAALEEAEAAGQPLTRRQARDLDRVRTATFGVIETPSVEPEQADAAPIAADEPSDEVVVAEAPAVSEPDTTAKKPTAKQKKSNRAQSSGGNRLPSFVPSAASAPAAEAEIVDAEIVPAEVDDDEPATAAVEPLTPPPAASSAFGPAADASARDDSEAPQLSSSFGQAVLSDDEGNVPPVDQPFDQIIARGLEEAGNGVSTSSIILPSMPNGQPLTGPLSANGNVVITGSIDLPSGMGSSGVHPDQFDRSDIDAMFDAEDEARPATGGTPVSASKAVSTHTATRDVITPPAPARSNRLLLILAITAGVLAVAVLSVIIVGIAAGAFQPR
jgi:hypothetical protein